MKILTENLQLDGFINASLKSVVRSLTSDFHTIHVLRDVEFHLSRRNFAAPQSWLVRDATVAH